MKVGVTAELPENVEYKKGVSRYIQELIPALDEELEVLSLKRRRDIKSVDIIHLLAPRVHYFPFLTAKKPVVVTIHAMDFFWPDRMKAGITKPAAFLQQRVLPKADRWINHYITVSEFLKTELTENRGIAESRITPIYHGISDRFCPGDVETENFVLTTTPTKEIVNCFSEVVGDYQLVIVGERGYGYSEAKKEAERLGILNDIRMLGYVTEPVLTWLYRKAACYVHWSGYEGFGFPPVEAMRSMTPVIANNAGSLPEVVNGGGIIVHSEGELRERLQFLIDHAGYRKTVAQRGCKWSKRYRWENTVRKTISVYRQLL